jgi:hypothetical protein
LQRYIEDLFGMNKKVEDTRSRESKKCRQYNSRKENDESTNNTTQKIKGLGTRTPQNGIDEPRCSGRASSYCHTSGTRCVTVPNPEIRHARVKGVVLITSTRIYLWLFPPFYSYQTNLQYIFAKL